MKIPDINEKNTRAFLDKVRERASVYTPEWRMNLEDPDGGTALALLFAGMHTSCHYSTGRHRWRSNPQRAGKQQELWTSTLVWRKKDERGTCKAQGFPGVGALG